MILNIHERVFKDFSFSVFSCSGEKPTADCLADAIVDNRAELVHLPASIDLSAPLPSKDCPTCDGTVSFAFSPTANALSYLMYLRIWLYISQTVSLIS